MGAFPDVEEELRAQPRSWLVTGAGGFIGSHLVERLLSLGQTVLGLDNFATGNRDNLSDLLAEVGPKSARNFRFIEGDIRDLAVCRKACAGINIVLHQAGLGSIPRSIEDPLTTHQVNINGFLNMMIAARNARVSRFVYATSSSVYGDEAGCSRVEHRIGNPRSPYALTKRVNELYARIFSGLYGIETIGLRYFNVFGRRQNPDGPYAAVIPRWMAALLEHKKCFIFGDGETSRDFCHVENVLQANLLAALAAPDSMAVNQVCNVGTGKLTTLNRLFAMIRDRLLAHDTHVRGAKPNYRPFRPGDVRHSKANISKAKELLGYAPSISVSRGLDETIEWYTRRSRIAPKRALRVIRGAAQGLSLP